MLDSVVPAPPVFLETGASRRHCRRLTMPSLATPPMSDRQTPRATHEAYEPVVEDADAVRTLLDRALRRAVEAAQRVVPEMRHPFSPTPPNALGDGRSVAEAAREPMRAACAAARARGIPIQRLLVLLKEAWTRVPRRDGVAREHGGEILARVVSLCIEEFYARTASRAAGGTGTDV